MKSDLYFRSQQEKSRRGRPGQRESVWSRLSGQKYTEECSKQTNEEGDTSGVWKLRLEDFKFKASWCHKVRPH